MWRCMHRAGIASLVVGLGLFAGSVPAGAQSIPVIVNVPTAAVAMPVIVNVPTAAVARPVTGGGVTPTIPGLVVGVPGLGGGKVTIERERSRTREKATIVIAE
jgi:hypothetical protein